MSKTLKSLILCFIVLLGLAVFGSGCSFKMELNPQKKSASK